MTEMVVATANRYHAAPVMLVRSTTPNGGDVTMNSNKQDIPELTPGALVECPTCGVPAEITDRFTLAGAPGPVEHVKVVCVRRHWYTLPVDVFPVSAPVSEHTSTTGITLD
jgi:hypothetical protein